MCFYGFRLNRNVSCAKILRQCAMICYNCINILRTNFLYKSLFGSFFYLHVTREKLPKRQSNKKFAHKMLKKLRPTQHHIIKHHKYYYFLSSIQHKNYHVEPKLCQKSLIYVFCAKITNFSDIKLLILI